MNSNLKNSRGAVPESLQQIGTLIYMNDAGAFVNNTLVIPVRNRRQYTINRIDLYITSFENPAVSPPSPAYPKWEQFIMGLSLKGFLANSGNSYLPLFNELRWFTPDGISATLVFSEPFIFQTNSPGGSITNTLNVTFSSISTSDTFFNALTGLTVPPPAGETIDVRGLISFQGVSYDLETAARVNNQRLP